MLSRGSKATVKKTVRWTVFRESVDESEGYAPQAAHEVETFALNNPRHPLQSKVPVTQVLFYFCNFSVSVVGANLVRPL